MQPQYTIMRVALTLVFAPVVLALLAAAIVSYYQFRLQPEVSLQEVVDYFYFFAKEYWQVVVGVYVWHSLLLVPVSLLLIHFDKLRLLFFMPAAYLLGSLIAFLLILSMRIFPDTIYMIPSAVMFSFYMGGTYGFVQGGLSWFMAGFHLPAREQHYATIH